MSFYDKLAFRLFSQVSEILGSYLTDVKTDLRKSRMKTSVQEYLSKTIMTSFIIFLVGLPILSFAFGFVLQSFLFSFIFAFTLSLFLAVIVFVFFLNYPKAVINSKAKELDNSLPFATLYLSTVAGTKLPLHKTFEIFSRFSGYGEVAREINEINEDVKVFGLDINTAIERAVERTPSKNFKELLWGILSAIRTGADLPIFLKEKSTSFMTEYRRKIYEFSHSLTVYIEVYLTAIVLGAIFFTILTAIIAGISGAAGNIVFLQFFLIFIFLPLVSALFIFLIKSITPGGE